MNKLKVSVNATVVSIVLLFSATANAAKPEPESYAGICDGFDYGAFKTAVQTAYTETNHFGFGLPMWASIVDHTGKICAVYSVKGGNSPVDNGGDDAGNNAWLGSRVISAQKASTANAFSLDALAIPTGGVSAAVYPGGSLYGLQHSNPVDTEVAYEGSAERWGTENDPLEGERPGGINVFGGGVALYNGSGVKVGAVGVSGDTSCRDHTMAYRLRIALGYNNQPNDDGLTFVATPSNLFEQPLCGVNDPTTNAWDSSATDFGARAP